MSNNGTTGINIDPNSFTPDELLKHTYRVVQEILQRMDEQKKEFASDKSQNSTKIEALQKHVTQLETRLEEKEKNFKQVMGLFGVAFTFLSILLSFAAYFLK